MSYVYFKNVRRHYFNRGFTLIEIMIYIPLVSLLLSGFISLAYFVHVQDMQLVQQIDDIYASTP